MPNNNPKAKVILAQQLTNEPNRIEIAEESLQFVIDFNIMMGKLPAKDLNTIAKLVEKTCPGEFGKLVQAGYKIALRCNTNNINPIIN